MERTPGAGRQEYLSAGIALARSRSFLPTESTSTTYSPRNPDAGSAPRADDTAVPMRITKIPSKTSCRFIDPPSFIDRMHRALSPFPFPDDRLLAVGCLSP